MVHMDHILLIITYDISVFKICVFVILYLYTGILT